MFARRLSRLCQIPRSSSYSTSLRLQSAMASPKNSDHRPQLSPRQFPSSGFEVIDPAQRVEEESLPFYNRDDYYPMRIGAVIKDRYQVVAKLGYGTSSTVWLCHDLRYDLLGLFDRRVCFVCPNFSYRDRRYWVLKVHVNSLQHNQELIVYKHLSSITTEHPGREYIRRLEDSFKLKSPTGYHDVFVMTPLGMSLRTLQEMQNGRIFDQNLVIGALDQVLMGLNCLHEANVIHTGKSYLTKQC
jgi:serine/threonine-protein kinase SRPK3